MAKSRSSFLETSSDLKECGRGVVVIIGVHLSLSLSIALIRCCGVLYLSWKNEFDTNAKETAAVLSIMSAMHGISGILGGIMTKRFGCRCSGMFAGALSSFGLLCSYWANNIFHLYIAAFIAGTGLGICYISGLSAIVIYFTKKYKTAHSIAFAGVGVGLMAVPPLLQFLLDKYGWRGCVLVTSAITAHIVVCSALYRPSQDRKRLEFLPRSSNEAQTTTFDEETGDQAVAASNGNDDTRITKDGLAASRGSYQASDELEITDAPDSMGSDVGCDRNMYAVVNGSSQSRPIIRLLSRCSSQLGFNTIVRSYRFLLLCLILFGYNISYTGFVTFIVPRAQSIDVAPSSAAFLLTALGVGSLLGRLGNGLMISWKISAENVTAICIVVLGVSLLIASVDAFALLAIASFAHGFATGALYAITHVLTRQFVGTDNFAVSSGFVLFISGVSNLTGPILAGWLIDVTSSYTSAFYVLSVFSFVSAFLVPLYPVLKRLEPGINVNHGT